MSTISEIRTHKLFLKLNALSGIVQFNYNYGQMSQVQRERVNKNLPAWSVKGYYPNRNDKKQYKCGRKKNKTT